MYKYEIPVLTKFPLKLDLVSWIDRSIEEQRSFNNAQT